MDALIHPIEEVIKPRDGHSPPSCRNWVPDERGREMFVWAWAKGMVRLPRGLGLNGSGTCAVLSLRIMKRSYYRIP